MFKPKDYFQGTSFKVFHTKHDPKSETHTTMKHPMTPKYLQIQDDNVKGIEKKLHWVLEIIELKPDI